MTTYYGLCCLTLYVKPMSSGSDYLPMSWTSISFPGGNLLELSFVPTLADWTGVHILSVFSSIGLCHFRYGRDSSVNSSFVFIPQLLEGMLPVSMKSILTFLKISFRLLSSKALSGLKGDIWKSHAVTYLLL